LTKDWFLVWILKHSGQFLDLLFVFRGKVLIILTSTSRLFWNQKTEIAVQILLMRPMGLEPLLRMHRDVMSVKIHPKIAAIATGKVWTTALFHARLQ
jgi:hypothetical protein